MTAVRDRRFIEHQAPETGVSWTKNAHPPSNEALDRRGGKGFVEHQAPE